MKYATPRAVGTANKSASCRLAYGGSRSGQTSRIEVNLRRSNIDATSSLAARRFTFSAMLIPFSCQPWIPVNGLTPVFRFVKYSIRQPAFHGSSDQPAVTALAQILIFWDPDAELDNSPVKGRGPNIDAETGSQLRKPVSHLTVTLEVMDSSQPVITRRRSIERHMLAGCSSHDPALSGKLRMDETINMPGGFSSTTPLLIPAKN